MRSEQNDRSWWTWSTQYRRFWTVKLYLSTSKAVFFFFFYVVRLVWIFVFSVVTRPVQNITFLRCSNQKPVPNKIARCQGHLGGADCRSLEWPGLCSGHVHVSRSQMGSSGASQSGWTVAGRLLHNFRLGQWLRLCAPKFGNWKTYKNIEYIETCLVDLDLPMTKKRSRSSCEVYLPRPFLLRPHARGQDLLRRDPSSHEHGFPAGWDDLQDPFQRAGLEVHSAWQLAKPLDTVRKNFKIYSHASLSWTHDIQTWYIYIYNQVWCFNISALVKKQKHHNTLTIQRTLKHMSHNSQDTVLFGLNWHVVASSTFFFATYNIL